jgi:hypothetical protein
MKNWDYLFVFVDEFSEVSLIGYLPASSPRRELFREIAFALLLQNPELFDPQPSWSTYPRVTKGGSWSVIEFKHLFGTHLVK